MCNAEDFSKYNYIQEYNYIYIYTYYGAVFKKKFPYFFYGAGRDKHMYGFFISATVETLDNII